MVHTCNPSAQEAGARGFPRVLGQPKLRDKILSKQINKQKLTQSHIYIKVPLGVLKQPFPVFKKKKTVCLEVKSNFLDEGTFFATL